jgi:hypothetical protein
MLRSRWPGTSLIWMDRILRKVLHRSYSERHELVTSGGPLRHGLMWTEKGGMGFDEGPRQLVDAKILNGYFAGLEKKLAAAAAKAKVANVKTKTDIHQDDGADRLAALPDDGLAKPGETSAVEPTFEDLSSAKSPSERRSRILTAVRSRDRYPFWRNHRP